MKRKFTFLGTGTSQGIPVIGCECDTCQSSDSKDTRFRTAGLVTIGERNIVIDTGPDFRQQMLAQKVKSIEAILFTHEHNDHIIGLDDIRPFYFMQGDIPIYGLKRVLTEIKTRFDYFFKENPYSGVPKIKMNSITPSDTLQIANQTIEPFQVIHGKLPILGYKFDNLVYITDAKSIEKEALQIIKNCDFLIVNALHHDSHHSHFNLAEAIAFVESVQPKQAWFTHMSHLMGKQQELSDTLPPNVQFAYDGLQIYF